VDVEDRRALDAQQPARVGERARGQQPVRLALRRGDDDAAGRQLPVGLLAGPGRADRDPPAARCGPQSTGTGGEQGAYARAVECGARQGVVEFAERHPGHADVGGAGIGQQPGAEDHGGQRQGGVGGAGVEGGDADQVPQRFDAAVGLAVAAQPAGEVLAVEGGVVRVEAAQRERGAGDGEALAGGEVGVAGERGRQVEGDGQRGAAQAAQPVAVGVEHRYVEAPLQRGERRAADPVEEAAVGGAATQVDVLAVVHAQLAQGGLAGEGEGESSQARAGLDEGDGQAPVGERQRRGDSRQSAPDDQRPARRGHGLCRRASMPDRPRTATSAFCGPGSATRPRSTASGSASMRSRSRW
jgi:hypothetical protein